jgi:hypothetical protein
LSPSFFNVSATCDNSIARKNSATSTSRFSATSCSGAAARGSLPRNVSSAECMAFSASPISRIISAFACG